jgi:iron complex transport system substrate-binding protein
MNTKYIIYIAAIIAVVSIVSAVFVYVYYEGQIANLRSEVTGLQTLVDDHGYVTSLASYPNRIVSLGPTNTEILFALGLDNKVVAVTKYDNYPYNFTAWFEAGNMTSVGDFASPNIEVIASLNPDLIIATGGVQDQLVRTLRDMGYKVLVLDPTSINGVFQDIALVGRAADKNAEAASLVNNMRSRIDAVAAKVANATYKPKVYFEVWYDTQGMWSVGSEGWETEFIEKAGGVNIFANETQKYFTTSSEAVITRNPDVILLPVGMETIGSETPFWVSFDAVKARPGWGSISAVQHDRLYQIDADAINRAGPRIADMIETLAAIFHPELF